MCYALFGVCLLADRREKTKAAAKAITEPSGSQPTIFELLQCWLLYGPSLETYSPSKQTFEQMLTCWDSNSYRARRTHLSAAIVKQCTEIYGKYYQAQGKGKTKCFPYIQLDEFRRCWVQYGNGSGNQTFLVMMDVWVENENAVRCNDVSKIEPMMEVMPQMEDEVTPQIEM